MTSNFHAPDIECEQCVEAIRHALSRLDGVHEVKVDVEACTVSVDHDEAQIATATIRALLEEVGYPAAP